MATIKEIAAEVCREYGLEGRSLQARGRTERISDARQVVCYLTSQEGIPVREIAAFLGRSRTTVLYSCSKVAGMVEIYEQYRDRVERVRSRLVSAPSAGRERP